MTVYQPGSTVPRTGNYVPRATANASQMTAGVDGDVEIKQYRRAVVGYPEELVAGTTFPERPELGADVIWVEVPS